MAGSWFTPHRALLQLYQTPRMPTPYLSENQGYAEPDLRRRGAIAPQLRGGGKSKHPHLQNPGCSPSVLINFIFQAVLRQRCPCLGEGEGLVQAPTAGSDSSLPISGMNARSRIRSSGWVALSRRHAELCAPARRSRGRIARGLRGEARDGAQGAVQKGAAQSPSSWTPLGWLLQEAARRYRSSASPPVRN